MPDLIVESVGLHRLAEIYPLIRSATRVSLERWKGFGEALLAGGGGVLAVIAPDDCIHGVATYRSIRNLRHEQSLQIEILVAFELIPHATVRRPQAWARVLVVAVLAAGVAAGCAGLSSGLAGVGGASLTGRPCASTRGCDSCLAR